MSTDWQHPEPGDDVSVSVFVNPSLATPAGYRPPAVPARVRLVDRPAEQLSGNDATAVPDHVLLGHAELSALRHTVVVLDDATWPSPLDVAAVVARLSCVGATVVTSQLPPRVRDLLPEDLLSLCDVLDSGTSVPPDRHEDLSIGVRRVAHRTFGHHPSAAEDTPSVVVVVDPAGGSADRLQAELTQQRNVRVSIVHAEGAREALARVSEAAPDGAYVADTRPDVTYGPHHLEDLVQALRHSGADLAVSPDRFEHQPRDGVFLEDGQASTETLLSPAVTQRPGTSMWYRSASSAAPRMRYAVHGCQTLVLSTGANLDGHRTHGRVRRRLPPQLSWAAETVETGDRPAPSYIARASRN